jgi:glycosyltransferase involved in cell wall biosynthesis
MNRTTQEAMACGKPVVVFNSGGTNKLISENQNGLLVESGNVKQLALAMYELYMDPKLRQKLGNDARKFIEQNRSWESRIKIELEVYDKLLSKKQS